MSLGEHFTDFIATQVGSGRYNSASDVIRAALRLLEENEARREALAVALREGEASGEPVTFDFDDFLQRKRSDASAA